MFRNVKLTLVTLKLHYQYSLDTFFPQYNTLTLQFLMIQMGVAWSTYSNSSSLLGLTEAMNSLFPCKQIVRRKGFSSYFCDQIQWWNILIFISCIGLQFSNSRNQHFKENKCYKRSLNYWILKCSSAEQEV